MAAFTWAQGSIEGIELNVSGDPVLCFILDGANLQPRRFVNNKTAADGSIYTQGFDTGGRGARFGVRFDNIPVSMLQQIIEAINTAIDNNESFHVDLEDDFQVVDADCKVDGSAWLSYPEQITNESFLAEVTMRFITT
jgi:hypothetical protein